MTTATAATGLAAMIGVSGDGVLPPGPSPEAALAPAVTVSPAGNDSRCLRRVASQPCRTLRHAYRLARCGEVVELKGGDYGRQVIARDARKDRCAEPVVFRPESRASVRLAMLCLGDYWAQCGGSQARGPSHVRIERVHVRNEVLVIAAGSDIALRSINGGKFTIHGANGVRVIGGDWGPCNTRNDPRLACSEQSFIGDDPSIGQFSRNVVIDGAVFHDYVIGGHGDHMECLQSNGGTNVTIRNSWFYNCQIASIAPAGVNGRVASNWLIENNWFGRNCCLNGIDGEPVAREREDAIIVPGGSVTGVLIRFNSFARGVGVITNTSSPTRARVIGNILGLVDCIGPSITWAYNLRLGGRCSRTERAVSSLPYVNPSNGRNGDYHLVPRSRALGLVKPRGGDYALARDRDGERRTAPRDAGADEWTARRRRR
jgi:hypothetical protein